MDLEDAVAVAPRVDPAAWAGGFGDMFALVAREFAQEPSRRRAQVAGIGDPAGVLVLDETGFLKKGRMPAGVQRQYTGTAGRIGNCQIGVFLAYAAPGGARALVDRELYLPESWCAHRDRCRRAGIGDGTVFATKPELGRQMLGRARDAGVPFSWVAAGEVYGQNPHLRSWLEGEGISYVVAVPCSETFTTAAGQDARRRPDRAGARRRMAHDELRRRLERPPVL